MDEKIILILIIIVLLLILNNKKNQIRLYEEYLKGKNNDLV